MSQRAQANSRSTPHTEIETEADLLPPGAAPGTVPTDIEQATGLERLEILGKIQGVDVFDMKPLDSSRKGTTTTPPNIEDVVTSPGIAIGPMAG